MDALLLKVSKDRSEDPDLRETVRDLLDAECMLEDDFSDLQSSPEFRGRVMFESAVHALSLALRALDRFAGEEHVWEVWRLAKRARRIQDEAKKRLVENI